MYWRFDYEKLIFAAKKSLIYLLMYIFWKRIHDENVFYRIRGEYSVSFWLIFKVFWCIHFLPRINIVWQIEFASVTLYFCTYLDAIQFSLFIILFFFLMLKQVAYNRFTYKFKSLKIVITIWRTIIFSHASVYFKVYGSVYFEVRSSC